MRRLIKDALASVAGGEAARALAGCLARFDDARPNVVRVLTYHRVDWPGARLTLNPRLISATPDGFAAQMATLAAGHPVVGLSDLLAAAQGEAPLPPGAVLVTFDDACLDFAEHAWPVMRRLGLPATLFVPTAYPDAPQRAFWWDRLYHGLWFGRFPTGLDIDGQRLPLATDDDRASAYDRLARRVKALPHATAMELVDAVCAAADLDGGGPEPAVLGWAALRALAAEGVALAPHTRTHPCSSGCRRRGPKPRLPDRWPTSHARSARRRRRWRIRTVGTMPAPWRRRGRPASRSRSPRGRA